MVLLNSTLVKLCNIPWLMFAPSPVTTPQRMWPVNWRTMVRSPSASIRGTCVPPSPQEPCLYYSLGATVERWDQTDSCVCVCAQTHPPPLKQTHAPPPEESLSCSLDTSAGRWTLAWLHMTLPSLINIHCFRMLKLLTVALFSDLLYCWDGVLCTLF